VHEVPKVDPVLAVAMVAAWVFLYMVIGGRWPKPFLSGQLTSECGGEPRSPLCS